MEVVKYGLIQLSIQLTYMLGRVLIAKKEGN